MKINHIHDPVPFEADDLLPEYDLDYSKAVPNPYLDRIRGHLIVAVDPDLSAVFTTPEAVNKALEIPLVA